MSSKPGAGHKAIPDVKERKGAMDALQNKYPALKEARWAHYNAKNETAGKGTDLHAELERYVQFCINENDGKPAFDPDIDSPRIAHFQNWAKENIERFLLSEANCYSEIRCVPLCISFQRASRSQKRGEEAGDARDRWHGRKGCHRVSARGYQPGRYSLLVCTSAHCA